MENKQSDVHDSMHGGVREGTLRAKMPVAQRAKQFMPFAAVTGLDEAIKRVELELEMRDKRVLSREAIETLKEVDKYD